MLERDKVDAGSILLVSDLETAPDDVPALARTIVGAQASRYSAPGRAARAVERRAEPLPGLLDKDAVADIHVAGARTGRA